MGVYSPQIQTQESGSGHSEGTSTKPEGFCSVAALPRDFRGTARSAFQHQFGSSAVPSPPASIVQLRLSGIRGELLLQESEEGTCMERDQLVNGKGLWQQLPMHCTGIAFHGRSDNFPSCAMGC